MRLFIMLLLFTASMATCEAAGIDSLAKAQSRSQVLSPQQKTQMMAKAFKNALRTTAGVPKENLAKYERYVDEYAAADLKATSKEENKTNLLNLMQKLSLPMPIFQDIMKNMLTSMLMNNTR